MSRLLNLMYQNTTIFEDYCDLNPSFKQSFDKLLERVHKRNGKRRKLTICDESVKNCLLEVMNGKRLSYRSGGTVANSYGYPAYTTMLLIARVDDKVYAGVSLSPCPSPSPGRAWVCLQPFSSGSVSDDKLRNWSKRPEIIEMS